ncbi:hypothetical protein L596_024721 [Steinernema carpocapsae]|uniref:Uncharacterized protein n=1 Tax=Steinernema carpocapsae TaxID=34508 RepID=A0A4U5M5K0_STECR|nr:hypothetical protein L596_024721 [Steinernema carpocapsae]
MERSVSRFRGSASNVQILCYRNTANRSFFMERASDFVDRRQFQFIVLLFLCEESLLILRQSWSRKG